MTLKLLILDTDDSQFAKIIPEILLTLQTGNTVIVTGLGKHFTPENSRKPRK